MYVGIKRFMVHNMCLNQTDGVILLILSQKPLFSIVVLYDSELRILTKNNEIIIIMSQL